MSQNTSINSNINNTQPSQPTVYYCSRCQVHYTIEQSFVTPAGIRQHKGWCMDKCDFNRMYSDK